jgi:surface polysaccharide O-acyltransferase-like enzyme
LIFYHIVISFFPETKALAFIVNNEKDIFVDLLINLSQALNIWRIPILFFIGGMALSFSSKKRSNKELIKERLKRIMLPLTFCTFFISPIFFIIHQNYYNSDFFYLPIPGYLWFLNSIFYYSLIILPIISLRKRNDNLFNFLNNLLRNKFIMLFLFSAPMILIAGIFNPKEYSNFVNFAATPFLPLGFGFNIHGFFVGLLCFLIGFLFASSGDLFWSSVRKIKYITLVVATILFLQRVVFYIGPTWDNNPTAYPLLINNILTAFESVCWMLSFVGIASTFLNKKKPILTYMTSAVFPVYIFHLPVQNFLASLIYPLSIAPIIKLIILIFSTILVSVFLYEIVKRLRWFRVAFGIRP